MSSGSETAPSCGPSMHMRWPNSREALARPRHGLDEVVRIDDHFGLMVGEIIVQIVGEFDVDERRDRPEPPRAEHRDDVVEPIVRDDRHAVALAHAKALRGRRPWRPWPARLARR